MFQIIDDNDVLDKRDVPPLLNKVKLLEEWPIMKALILGTYKTLNTELLCRRIITLHNMEIPNCVKLCKISLCLCITSVECERTFSTQNRLKNKFRCSLKNDSLDVLMRVSLIGPSVENYNPVPSIIDWNQTKRRIGRLVQPYKALK